MDNITTKRLLLRAFQPDDWKDLYEYLSDVEVVRYEPYEAYNEEQAKEEAIQRTSDEAFVAVCLRDSGKLIGNLYFSRGDFDTWELGYVFNKTYHGKGYAFESANALLDYSFCKLGARRIVAMCNPDNISSWKLLDRLHMRREGHLLKNISFKTDTNGDPIWLDTFEYAILKEEWDSLK